MNKHEKFLTQAMELATKGARSGSGPFGCVIVKAGKIIATGKNEVTKKHDPTAHAEMIAIRAACKKLGSHELKGCTVYSSSFPCPMCLSAIYWARPKDLYHTNTGAQASEVGFDDNYIYKEINKPNAQRAYRATRIILPNSLKAIEAWNENDNKKLY